MAPFSSFTQPAEEADYTVVYRFGGRDNFEWRKTGLRGTFRAMSIEKAKLIRAGYMAYVYSPRDIRIGLPDTYGRDVAAADIRAADRCLEISH